MSFEDPSVDSGGGVAAGSDDASDVEVARVLESYLAAVEAGQPADPRRLLDDHPHLADQLRACLRVLRVAEQAAQEVTAAPGAAQPRPAAALPQGFRAGLSALSTLDFGPAEPQVLLRELADETEPLLNPHSTAMPPHGASIGRFQLLGELARGGMGAVLKGHDVDLGRDLAIKVLLESHRGDPEVVRRFVEEAQIGGQLQHPGVVPVYELGTFPDRRPYFAMKLVKGRTLASLLQERAEPGQDLSRFVSIFEQVCQTMAYAHARGVIHRDLKPTNVMVGSFGEVQVMDWGLAKVLPQGGIADESGSRPDQETVMMTVRSGPAGSDGESQPGSVLGTPSYMAPEQARGELDRIDERADVFGLGAMLCEVLTSRQPFVGTTREEIRAQAERGDLADARVRLDACGADVELIALTKVCLAPEPERRPRNAGEVARRVGDYLAGVQERLKAAELARVEAQAKAVEERKRRRLTAALAASVLVTAGVLGGGWTYLARQRTARLMATTRVVTDALAEAERLRGQAQSPSLGDLTKWSEATGTAKRARDLLAEGEADNALRIRVMALLADLEHQQAEAEKRAAEAERDRKLLGELETIRGRRSEHGNSKRTDAEYTAAFRAFGIDLDQLDPKEAGTRIAQRSAAVELAFYLDDWALRRRAARDNKAEPSWRRLLEAARTADPDPWRAVLRAQIGSNDQDVVRQLALDLKTLESHPAPSLVLLASALKKTGDQDRAEQVLRLARRLAPGDFWVNFEASAVHWMEESALYDRPEEAARFLSAAVAIRPRSTVAHNNLGNALHDQGKLDEAIAEYRAALRLNPNYTEAHNNLGVALRDQGKLDEAIAEYRAALRLKPDYPDAHNNLGVALHAQGKREEAFAEIRQAIRLRPDDFLAHYNLGIALRDQGKLDEAIAEYRAALRLNPNYAEAHCNLGHALGKESRFAESFAEHKRGHELGSKRPNWPYPSAQWVKDAERLLELDGKLPAILSGKRKPADASEILGFAQVCHRKNLYGASARFWAEAFQAKPNLVDDRQAQHRYNAACAAALAACGQGKDNPPLDDAAKARWRKQAIDWLKADLAAWSKSLQGGPPEARQSVSQTLKHWKADPELTGIRDQAALAKLPADEQNACRALWAEVDAMLAKARGGTAP
jgi:serine/threonine-protein kinase